MAYAGGDEVAAEWSLFATNAIIPDLLVCVWRVDGAGSRAMRRTFATDDDRDFKAKLHDFLLEEFADGADIAGRWGRRYGFDDLPAWDVAIEIDDVEATAAGNPHGESP